ncbi:hypothetical protein E2C01_067443 [Portunus trituberculatus]|uniref:Uncharacterized protein n=1 Tax=Portunus trituberculatus TaxID=210409 RepID=A0A5B7HTM2_PORTR|nr:hypothetical protein [Portunus trituberculatus]
MKKILMKVSKTLAVTDLECVLGRVPKLRGRSCVSYEQSQMQDGFRGSVGGAGGEGTEENEEEEEEEE